MWFPISKGYPRQGSILGYPQFRKPPYINGKTLPSWRSPSQEKCHGCIQQLVIRPNTAVISDPTLGTYNGNNNNIVTNITSNHIVYIIVWLLLILAIYNNNNDDNNSKNNSNNDDNNLHKRHIIIIVRIIVMITIAIVIRLVTPDNNPWDRRQIITMGSMILLFCLFFFLEAIS